MKKINEFKKELTFEERVELRRELFKKRYDNYVPYFNKERVLEFFKGVEGTLTFDKNGKIHQFDIIDGKKIYADGWKEED
jgi:hypothetical protein